MYAVKVVLIPERHRVAMCHDVCCRDILEKAEGKINWRGPARQIAGQAHPLVQRAHGQFLARANAVHPERQVDFKQGRHARSLPDGPTRVVHNGHRPFAAIDKVVSRVLQQHALDALQRNALTDKQFSDTLSVLPTRVVTRLDKALILALLSR